MYETTNKGELIHYRGSYVPGSYCPASVDPLEYSFDEDSEPARMGRVVHKGIGGHIQTGGYPNNLEEICRKKAISYEDTSFLLNASWRVWNNRLKEAHKGLKPNVEQELSFTKDGVHFTGHPDVYSFDPDKKLVIIDDFKTGRVLRDYSRQMLNYCVLVMFTHALDEDYKFQVRLAWVRFNQIDEETFTQSEIIKYADDLIERFRPRPLKMIAGDHCPDCKRKTLCDLHDQASRKLLRIAGQDEKPMKQAVALLAKEGRLGAAYAAAKDVISIAEKFKTAVKVYVGLNDPVEIGDGKIMTIAERETKSIKVVEAWPVLKENLTDAELAGCMKFSKTKIEDAIKDKTATGGKGQAAEVLIQSLADAGAISLSMNRVLSTRKKPAEKKK